jgi:hypothetical protein
MPPQLVTRGSYRRLICKSNKDSASASWPFAGRACMYETRRVFLRLQYFLSMNARGNQDHNKIAHRSTGEVVEKEKC